jgi:hypothetical protein
LCFSNARQRANDRRAAQSLQESSSWKFFSHG